MTEKSTPKDPHAQTTAVSARWRIVGWIVLTTALALLATTVSMRTLLLHRVATDHNAAIVQEIEEFRLFTQEGAERSSRGSEASAKTSEDFSSLAGLMQRYLAQQTPATGEAMIGFVDGQVFYTDNASSDAGERLASDAEALQKIIDDSASSGVLPVQKGTARWGKTQVRTQDGAETGTFVVVQFNATEVHEVNRQTIILAAVAAGGLLMTAGIAWLVAGRILQPIRTMRAVAGSVTAQDLSARIPIHGRDDISQLGVTLNGMLDRVEEAHASQRHFVTEARHRLQEPLERIRQTLSGQEAESNVVHRQLRLMERILENLEILSEADLPGFIRPAEHSAEQVTDRLFASASRRAQHRRWTLSETAQGSLRIDADRVDQAVARLVRNAADHTEDGDPLELGTALEGDRFTVWVANRGPALDEDAARELFESYRSGSSAAAEPGEHGMGLGLAVVKAVADAHHGSAWVESDEHSTRFGLDLPTQPPRDSSTGVEDEVHAAAQADGIHRTMGAER